MRGFLFCECNLNAFFDAGWCSLEICEKWVLKIENRFAALFQADYSETGHSRRVLL
ncbi:hypothetical protein [Paraburkholderia youngii]|uniref:hypothetical protein n=1 Tax=Paraburkholderia youngii TaxID=2782701 RepID=UPI0015905EAE|nr:hypothetical protein [Paraburkholderia youngii]